MIEELIKHKNVLKIKEITISNKFIRNNLKTSTNKICSKTKTRKNKLKPATRELMMQRRNMQKDTSDYTEVTKHTINENSDRKP